MIQNYFNNIPSDKLVPFKYFFILVFFWLCFRESEKYKLFKPRSLGLLKLKYIAQAHGFICDFERFCKKVQIFV